jgi:hypothetical protein
MDMEGDGPLGLHVLAALINAGPFGAWMTAWGIPADKELELELELERSSSGR